MSSDPPELGKGLFGYRKSAVNQIIADRDIMLRQAEGRVRAAESKVADLETELGGMRDRNTRMDEQIERLRQQLDALTRSAGIPPAEQPPASEAPPAPTAWEEEPADQAVEAAVETYTEEPATRGYEEPAIPSYDEAPTPAYEEQQLTPAFGEAHSPAVYGDEEPLEAEGDWPAAEQDWPGSEQATPMVEADAGTTAGTSVEDDLTYGDEVQLGEDTASETSEPTWMQTGTSGQDEAEHDEVAMAGGGYRYGDYGSQPEEPGHTDYVSPEEGEQEEAPSPFSRFPFASEAFDHAGEEVAPVPEGAYQEEEPAAYVPPMESETAPTAEQTRADAPEHAAAAPERVSAVSQETSDITNRFLTEELSGILSAAEESASRIVERARATTQRQIARSNRVWREVQAEVARFASWREEVEPVIRAVQSKVEGVRAEIEEVPERIRQALAPMADSISSIDGDLADLAAACNPPLLLAPGGLESKDADHSSWG
ncbi:MAG: hypothetical protein ACRDI1_01195, partial [Actinomycetota bacterium]